MGCRNSKPVAVETDDGAVTMVSLTAPHEHKEVPTNDTTANSTTTSTNTASPPPTVRKSSVTNLLFGSSSVNQSTDHNASGSLPALLPSQRESSRSIISTEQRVEMNRRASIEDFLLSKHVVKAIDAATTELSLAQPPDAVGVNFPQLLEFPVRAFKLTNLAVLSLKNNKLEKLPAEFGQKLPNLTSFDISENQLTVVPDCICDCVHLETLDISENMIVALPALMGNLIALKNLIAFKNNLTSLPTELSTCTALMNINVFNNKILRIPEIFGSAWINLTEFNAGSNKLKMFPAIPGWTNVTRIALQWNGIVEAPDFSPAENSLVQVQLNDNALNAFPILGQAKNLTLLDISSNIITEIPGKALEPLLSLETFTIRKNKLNSLPEEFFRLPKLSLCDMQENEFTTISPSISGLKDTLITLLLNKNSISTIPETFRELNVIKRLNLESNIGLDLKSETVRQILWDVRDKCVANGGWLRTSGTALGSRPKPPKEEDEPRQLPTEPEVVNTEVPAAEGTAETTPNAEDVPAA